MVKNISEYGKKVKIKLTELGKEQNWLIEQVREKTGLYFDSSYMHKIFCGTEKSKNIIAAINETLGIEEEP